MADSPNKGSSDVLALAIKIEGEDVSREISLEGIVISKAVNRIAKASLTIVDGDMPNGTFPVSDSDRYAPGNSIVIEAGYGSEVKPIFTGLIVKHGVRITDDNRSQLKIECFDETIKMTIARKNANYVALGEGDEVKDSEVMQAILANYSAITAEIDDTTSALKSLVQYNASDWDFVVARAESNAMLVFAEDQNFKVRIPEFNGDPVLTLNYGVDIMDFKAELDTRFQLSSVTAVTWNQKTLAVEEESSAAESDTSSQAEVNGDLSGVMGVSEFRLFSQAPLEKQNLSDWSKGQLSKSKLSLLRGHMRFQGNASPTLGCLIEVQGVGARFSGKLFCSAIEHHIANGTWTTEVDFGCSAHWFSQTEGVSATPASALLPAAEGLQVGIVQQLDQDPEGQYRVQVNVPVLKAETQGIWARMIHPYASAGFGSFFIPEIGDEVVLAYFNNDPGFPVILGSLYSQKNTSPEELTADNFIKSITTKSGLKFQFDDDKKIVRIETPGGHSFALDDDQQNIVTTDSNGNTVEMSSSGISLSSPGDITLAADGNISMTATGKIEGKATQAATISGMSVDLSAETSFSASGQASAELTASGSTTIKGAMVMIN